MNTTKEEKDGGVTMEKMNAKPCKVTNGWLVKPCWMLRKMLEYAPKQVVSGFTMREEKGEMALHAIIMVKACRRSELSLTLGFCPFCGTLINGVNRK